MKVFNFLFCLMIFNFLVGYESCFCKVSFFLSTGEHELEQVMAKADLYLGKTIVNKDKLLGLLEDAKNIQNQSECSDALDFLYYTYFVASFDVSQSDDSSYEEELVFQTGENEWPTRLEDIESSDSNISRKCRILAMQIENISIGSF